jgi:hypothetical protein
MGQKERLEKADFGLVSSNRFEGSFPGILANIIIASVTTSFERYTATASRMPWGAPASGK